MRIELNLIFPMTKNISCIINVVILIYILFLKHSIHLIELLYKHGYRTRIRLQNKKQNNYSLNYNLSSKNVFNFVKYFCVHA